MHVLRVEFLALPHSPCMTFGRSLVSQFLLNKVGITFLCYVEVIQLNSLTSEPDNEQQ